VFLRFADGQCRLEVSDNGRPDGAVEDERGFGPVNLRRRAEKLQDGSLLRPGDWRHHRHLGSTRRMTGGAPYSGCSPQDRRLS
jgi:hypothetical protein